MTTAGQAATPVALDVSKAREAELTARQSQVLGMMCGGLSNEEIGQALRLAPATVKGIARHVFLRLGAVNRAHAVALAFAANLVRATHIGAAP